MIFKTLFEKQSVAAQAKGVIHNILERSKTLLLDSPSKPLVSQLAGDKDVYISDADKDRTLKQTIEYLMRKDLHMPQFGARFGKPVTERKFDELIFTMGFKQTAGTTHFSRDALDRVVCYNLSVVGIQQYVFDKRQKGPEVRTLIDPYSFIPIPSDVIKERYNSDPLYEEFMEVLGKFARK